MLKNKKKIALVSITTQQEEFSFDVNILEKELEPLIVSFIFLVALVYEEEKNVIQLQNEISINKDNEYDN